MAHEVDHLLEQTQWDLFWILPIVTVVDRPELQFLSCQLDLAFLNCVNRTRAREHELDALIAEVSVAHTGVKSRWTVPSTFRTDPLERALGRNGYKLVVEHRACAIDVDAYRHQPGAAYRVVRVTDEATLRLASAVSDEAFGNPRAQSDWEVQLALMACTRPDGRIRRYLVFDEDDRPVCAGALNTYPELDIAFFWGGGTIPDARHAGAYSALVAHRIAEVRKLGLSRAGLYARTDSSAPVVQAQGFAAYGSMAYWERPA